jgi:hypothetical protein
MRRIQIDIFVLQSILHQASAESDIYSGNGTGERMADRRRLKEKGARSGGGVEVEG